MRVRAISSFFLLVMLSLISPRPYAPAVVAKPSGSFDGTQAYSRLGELVEMGARSSGSSGARQAQEYIIDKLRRLNLEVMEQDFTLKTPRGPRTMKNIIGLIPGRSEQVILLGTHYDTKYRKGMEIVGANDGASGPATVLELAECLSRRPLEPSIWVVFFDGEESYDTDGFYNGLYGSRYFVHDLKISGAIAKIKATIILDMVGDAHLRLEKDYFSTSWLTDIFWENARRLGRAKSFTDIPSYTNGDHIPFARERIPVLSLNDFNYGRGSRSNKFWHSPEDALDKVSPDSLEAVGEVVLASLPEIASAQPVREQYARPKVAPPQE